MAGCTLEIATGAPVPEPTTLSRIADAEWRRTARLTVPFAVGFGAILLAESVAIARIDRWLPIDSFEAAAKYSLYVSAVALWLRLCLVGGAVYVALKGYGRRLRPGFLWFWATVSAGLALALLAVDLWAHLIQFGATTSDGVTQRWLWLTTLYVRIICYYIAVRLLLGAFCLAAGDHRWSLKAAWTSTTTLQSLMWFLVLVAVKLFIDGVIVNFVSYAPVISPLWFIPDELSPMRYFVSHGIDIVTQSCGVFLYVAFWIVADRWLCAPEPGSSGS